MAFERRNQFVCQILGPFQVIPSIPCQYRPRGIVLSLPAYFVPTAFENDCAVFLMLEAPGFCHQQISSVPRSLEQMSLAIAVLNYMSVTAQFASRENDTGILRIRSAFQFSTAGRFQSIVSRPDGTVSESSSFNLLSFDLFSYPRKVAELFAAGADQHLV